MQTVHSSRSVHVSQTFVAVAAVLASVAPAFGDVFTLRNGMQLTGSPGKISKMGEAPVSADSGGFDSKPILLIDDDLRRYFLPDIQVQTFAASPAAARRSPSITQGSRSRRWPRSRRPGCRCVPRPRRWRTRRTSS